MQDLADVRAMIERDLVEPNRVLEYLVEVENELYRYPAIDARSFRRQTEEVLSAC